MARKLVPYKMSRLDWGLILALAAVVALAGAWLLERYGLRSPGLRPMRFVGVVVVVKFALFTAWPWMTKPREGLPALPDLPSFLAATFKAAPAPALVKTGSGVSLWDERDPRLGVVLFEANVPTFVLNQEQRMIDWNPAFELVFAGSGLRRGALVSEWYALLDNFRRMPKRTDKLYGEAVLPLTDRERATFLSPEFGRMVFTKIMAPVVDRGSGRILGWTVALNINSVNRRHEFFEQLYGLIAAETRRSRYAASYDGLMDRASGRRRLLDLHMEALKDLDPCRVLELGCGTGALTTQLLAHGHQVTAVERDTQLLRRAKERCAGVEPSRVRLVRQDPSALANLPMGRYQAAMLAANFHRLANPFAALASVYEALEPGGVLALSARVDGGTAESLFESVRADLDAQGAFESLKHQFNHVLAYERDLAEGRPLPTPELLTAWLVQAGFTVEHEHPGLEDGHTLLIIARR